MPFEKLRLKISFLRI